MKRFLIFFLLFCTSMGAAFAQSSEAQKRIHMAAERICAKIDVDNVHKDEFISIYQSYKKDMSTVRTIKPTISGNSEQAVEAKIRCDFVKSEKILEIRKNYYEKFRTILRPSQIQQMYDIEREWASSGTSAR